MKIGLLAYHAACNYGAFLQLLSTVEYLKKHGEEPIVINWVPKDFRKDYEKRSLPTVRDLYTQLQKQYYPLTDLCETEKEVALVIEKEHIEAVIVGSDAVTQHHPFRERFVFPCRRIIYIGHYTSDRMYPNCFWGSFNSYLKSPIPIAVISGSSQDSLYYYITGRTKAKMKKSILSFRYMSVRDDWTQKMISYLTDGVFTPSVTPDPVFGFNQNASHLLPRREDIISRFNLPEKYIIISFRGTRSVDQKWIDEFEILANKCGYACVKLPYADMAAFGKVQYDVGNEISPLEWYSLIKYSKGYVGNNMHPIVTSMVNGIPFYCFDNYGIATKDGRPTNGESSKIYHILNSAKLLDNRVFVNGKNYTPPSCSMVFNCLESFDIKQENNFAESYYGEYREMMEKAIASLKD